MKIIYETNRLIIRQWKPEDEADMYEYYSDKNVTKFLSFPSYQSREDAKRQIALSLENYQKDSFVQEYCIVLKDSNKVIGDIGITHYQEKNQGEAEIGYVLNPKFQGYGFMTECLLGFFRYIKTNKIAKRIIAKHDVENTKSGKVMERAGMILEGILRKAGVNQYHSRCDQALYSILDEEIKID